MKKVLIIHPEGNINNNPNLTGIVEILCENGYKVDICSLRRSNIYQYSWCAGASLFLLDRPESLVENGTFILEDPKLNSQEKITSYINENFKSYDLVIGVDKGIIEAALIAQNRQIPCGLISYEIFFEEETSREFKQEEIEACKCLDFIVCQDELRAKYLSIENKIALDKIINIPVAGRGIKKGEKNSYLYDSLGIDKDKKIALLMGSVAQWSMADYILESAKLWSEDWVLVVHSRYGFDQHVRPYYEKYKCFDNIYFSLKPIANPNQLDCVIHSADVGIAFYEPTYQSKYTGNNIKYLGMASGKIATYLQHGLPIIINEIGRMSDYVRKYGIGLVVDDNGNFNTSLTDDRLLKFRLNCLEFFEKRLDLNHTIVPLLKIIQRLSDKQAVTVSSENSLALGTKDFLAGKVEHPVINSAEKYNLSRDELLGRKDIDGALTAFKKAIEVAPHFIAAHNNIGKAYLQKGKLAYALKHFTKALKIDPYDLATVLNCGQVLTSHGLVQEARSLYRSYLQENPNDNKVINALENLNCEKKFEGRNDVTPEYKKDLIARTEHVAMQQSQGDVESRKYLVSAIVSMYNSQRFIRGCLEDLENQTIADKLEIIVINSGSQENEEAIVHEYQQKHNNIVYIKTEQREGIYTAWNRAIKVARGTFLTNANTDDRHREDAMEVIAETLLANPDFALVYGDQICTDTPNGTFANHHTIEMAGRAEYSHERLLFGCCVGSQPMWRKSLHTELGYFDDTLTCAGDWDFWLRISISSRYKFKHIPEFLGLYYYNENGIEHGRKIHSLYERYIVGKRYGNPYISVIPLYTSKDNPLVSVIMPAYNAAEHIAEAIESVLIQNYRNFELIVVDDGSTDDTKDIVASFKDDKIKYLYKDNGGPSSARNLAINKAKGQYIMPLDADDMMTPDFIAKHLAEFEKHPDVDLVYCDVLLIDENSNPIRIMNKPEYQDRRYLIRDLFRAGHPVVPFRLGIRRSVFERIGFYDEDLLIGEDYDMMRRFVKAGLKEHHLSEPLHLRRMHTDSLSTNYSTRKAKSHFEVVKRFVDTFAYDELFPDVAWDEIAPQMRQLHAKCLAAGTYLAIGQDYVKTKATECSRTAFDLACSELNDCVKMDPGNQDLWQLLQKSKLIRARYTEAPQQVVS